MLTIAWNRTGKTMPLLAFTLSSCNLALALTQFVLPSGHAERSVIGKVPKVVNHKYEVYHDQ